MSKSLKYNINTIERSDEHSQEKKLWTTFILFIAAIFLLITFASCEKNIDLNIKPGQPQLVVEAYINNAIPQYNYVILSHSQDYFAPNFQSIPVANATVTITEGTRDADGNYTWNQSSKLKLKESLADSIPASLSAGLYFDQRIYLDPPHALRGNIGKSYLLEINVDGQNYSAITSVIQPVLVDSITQGFPFVNDLGDSLFRITNHYRDPDTLGNAQFYFWRFSENKKNFGWGGFTKSRAPGTDDLYNGEYVHLTHPQGFSKTDTINYYMASVTRDVYNFWDSYNKAHDNNGPFSTPVNLITNIKGNNVTGCFSGFAISSKTIVIR